MNTRLVLAIAFAALLLPPSDASESSPASAQERVAGGVLLEPTEAGRRWVVRSGSSGEVMAVALAESSNSVGFSVCVRVRPGDMVVVTEGPHTTVRFSGEMDTNAPGAGVMVHLESMKGVAASSGKRAAWSWGRWCLYDKPPVGTLSGGLSADWYWKVDGGASELLLGSGSTGNQRTILGGSRVELLQPQRGPANEEAVAVRVVTSSALGLMGEGYAVWVVPAVVRGHWAAHGLESWLPASGQRWRWWPDLKPGGR